MIVGVFYCKESLLSAVARDLRLYKLPLFDDLVDEAHFDIVRISLQPRLSRGRALASPQAPF